MQYVFLSTLNNFFKRTDNKNANVLNFLLAVLNKYMLNICACTHLHIPGVLKYGRRKAARSTSSKRFSCE